MENEPDTDRKMIGLCPKCSSDVHEATTGYICSAYDCDFRLPGVVLGQALNSSQAAKLLRDRRTDLLSGLVSKDGRKFSASLVLDATGHVTFDYSKEAVIVERRKTPIVAGLTMSIVGVVLIVISAFVGFYMFTTKQFSFHAGFPTNASTSETQIQIPTPVGFVEGSRLSDVIKKQVMAGDLVSVKLIGAYYPPDVLAEVLNHGNEALPLSPFCVAKLQETYRSNADANEGFQHLKVNIKKDILSDMNDPDVRRILEHYEKAVTELSPDTPVKIKGFVPVNTLIDSETVFAGTMIENINVSGEDLPMAAAYAFVLVGTQQVRVVVVYPFTSQADIETAKRALLQWVSDIQRLNGL
jgi:hypothetical protein